MQNKETSEHLSKKEHNGSLYYVQCVLVLGRKSRAFFKKKKLIVDETSTYENYMLKALLSYCLACKKYVLAKI